MMPQQAHDRAWEMIREKYILLPPQYAFYGGRNPIVCWRIDMDRGNASVS